MHRFYRSFTYAAVIAIILPFWEGTAQSPPAKRFTLEEVIRTAVHNNHDLASERLEVGRADARLREAWGYALPTLDVTGRYTRAIQKPVFFFPNIFDTSASKRGQVTAIAIGSDNSFDLTMTLSQVLFNSAVFTGVGTAKTYAQAAREVYRSKLVATVTGARKAYYSVLLASAVKDMMESNLANAEENARNASILATQGLISEYDRLRSEVALANVRPEVIRAQSNYELALNGLKLAMGVPFDEPVAVDGELTFTPVDDVILADATSSVLDSNPSLVALRLQKEVNDAITAIERSSYLPSLAAFGTYQYQGQKNDLRISTRDFVNSSLVGLSLAVNIFNGFRTSARVEQAELETRKTQEHISHLEITLQTAVHSTGLSLKRAAKLVEAADRTVEQAERGYRIATTRFTTGSGTQLEVHDAQLALTTAKTNRIQAIFDYLVTSADLDQLLGRKPDYVLEDIKE
jgi:outer membrane protein